MVDILTVTGLSKAYSAVKALDGVDLALAAGEVHALMGENGAGKSTLIKCLAGVERPDSGTISIAGVTRDLSSPQDAVRLGLRFIHQELNVVDHLSVAENIHLGHPYPARFGLIDWSRLNRAAAAALAELSIDWIDPATRMARLSTGDRMLVKIAAALLAGPGGEALVHVMDEPTAALNEAESARLFDVIGRLKARGAAILYVSHRMDEVMALSDRITVLRDGRHVATRARSETDAARLIEDMTGRSIGQAFPARKTGPADAVALSLNAFRTAGLAPAELTVRKGEILGIAGLEGAGQDLLLEAMIGARPALGTLSVDGKAGFVNREPAEAWARGFAYVPRERRREGIIASASVTANTVISHLAALARIGVLAHARAETTLAERLAGQVRLKHAGLGQPVRQLSGGNQQKVVLARAIAGMPKVLLLDEPTRGVDVGAKFDIHTLVRDLAAGGMAVIMASTDLPELVGMADRIAIMAEGRIAAIIDTEGLDQAGLLQAIYAHQAAGPSGRTEQKAAAQP